MKGDNDGLMSLVRWLMNSTDKLLLKCQSLKGQHTIQCRNDLKHESPVSIWYFGRLTVA
jgi:hypothetical protein